MAKRFPIFKDESGVGESSAIAVFDETSTPANAANQAKIYAKDVAGVSKMHALDSTGAEIELGTGGGGGSSLSDAPQHSNTQFSPVAVYVLNSSLADTSGNGNDLSVGGGSEEYYGANHVPGDSSFHSVGNWLQSTVPAARVTGEVTVMAWINPAVFSSCTVVSCDGGGETEAGNILWNLGLDTTGRVRVFHEFGAGSSNSIVSSSNYLLREGTNQHVVMSRAADGITYKIYVNGVFVETLVASTPPTGGTSNSVTVGANIIGSDAYSGSVWDIAIYDTQLTDAQIKAEYQRQVGRSPVVKFGRALPGLEHNPLGLYLFQGNGLDSSGNGRDLSNLDGTPTYGDGFVGLSFEQDGNVGLTRVDSTFEILGAVSAYAIVKLVSTTDTNFTIVCYDGGSDPAEADNNLWSLDLVSTAGSLSVRYFHEYSTGVNELLLPTGIGASRDEWIMVGWTRDSAGTGIKIFLNGEVIGTTTLANAPTGGTSSDLVVGRIRNSGVNNFTGKISAVKIVGSELTEAEMKAEYDRCFGVGDGTGIAHQALHLSGADDEIDGDQLDIDWNPTNYTPTAAPAEVSSVDHLTAHLAGIDSELQFDSTVQTADATVTVIHTVSTVTDNSTWIEATIQGIDGTANEVAFYKFSAFFFNNAGTVTQKGTTTTLDSHEDDASWGFDLNISGTDVQIRVTGDATNVVEWRIRGFTVTHG